MSRRKSDSYPDVKYSHLHKNDTLKGHQPNNSSSSNVPLKAIGLATVLFMTGFVLLTAGCLTITGHLSANYEDRMWPFIILGALMFIPGVYHVRVAYYAFREVPGYSYQDIPEFD